MDYTEENVFNNTECHIGLQGTIINYGHINTTNDHYLSGRLDARKREILRELYKTSYQDHKERNIDRIPGTCEWFTTHKRFREWQENKSSKMLWVSADPGCGKSVLAKYLIDSVLTTTEDRTICYFFFKEDFEEQKSIMNALCCILHQLFKQKSALLSETIFKKFEVSGEGFTNSFTELWGTLLSVAKDKNAGEIVCILDAIDECENYGRSQLIKALRKLYGTSSDLNLKFLLTSRPYREIRRDFLGSPESIIHLAGESEVEMDMISREIDIFIKARVQDIGARRQLKIKDQKLLLQKLMEIPNRTYLWVYLTLDLIESDIYIDKIGILNAITQVSKTIDEAYERILFKSRDVEKAKELLQIVIAVARPLSLKEMSLVLALGDNHMRQSYSDLNLESEEQFREYIRELCGFLITIKDSRIYLLHQTAKEFFVQNNISNSTKGDLKWKYSLQLQDSHRVLAKICTQYLLFEEFEDPPLEDSMLPEYIGNYVFLDYSSKNWTTHLHESQLQVELDETEIQYILNLCDANSKRCLTWFRIYWTSTNTDFPKNFTNIMIASYFGLTAGVIRLLEMDISNSIDLDSKDDVYRRSAVSWAAGNGFDDIVELLVGGIGGRWNSRAISIPFRKGAQVDSIDKDRRTPLVHAVWGGHVAVVNLLLKAGARIDLEDNVGGTPRVYAICSGRHDIARLVSKEDTGTDVGDGEIASLLWSAASKGQEAVLKLMLKTGIVDPDLKDRRKQTPLSIAAKNGHETVIRLLLETGNVDPDSKDLNERTPLSYAAKNGHEATVLLLLETGKVDSDYKDRSGRTPLSYAVENGHKAIVLLLLEIGKVDPDSKNSNELTPLSEAAKNGREAIVKLLLKTGKVDPDSKSRQKKTPLSQAAENGHEAVVIVLLATGKVDLNSKDWNGWTPLSHAVERGNLTIVQALLDGGAKTDNKYSVVGESKIPTSAVG
ncbi:hypothetical protein AOL_s00081g270 [Orbilia oligospora ATCC 24927]|uniref:NACHT domain-containing protein n=2 Tax=Orbilia oligospora TaxID=2813651 RepID=G1XFX7_ARTOA|nr:hypothetical protein AOL_s00081g270 [Orbilia oligospora ATCC 24927]EGX47943.1 hypothetical protein AOL_s00081g270 [Orbilia oligospora ATCC 24927]